jgi:hypothetical protein
MNLPTTVPVNAAPDALAHVESLGMQAEFEKLIEHAAQTLPGLLRIEVTLEPPYDTGDEDVVLIEPQIDPTVCSDPGEVRKRWVDWKLSTFSPDVLRHISFHL